MKQLRSLLATPLLFFRQVSIKRAYKMYRQKREHQKENSVMFKALSTYFSDNSPELVKYFNLMIFQCWCMNDCKIKAEVSGKDFALYLDQLNDLVEAAHRFHKHGNRVPPIV